MPPELPMLDPRSASDRAGSQTIPAGNVAGSGLDSSSLVDQVNQVFGRSIPGSTVPFTTGTIVSPKMPIEPTGYPTNRNTQITPYANTVEAKKTARQQSMGNMLGNFTSRIVNQQQQKKYQENVQLVKDVATALQAEANAKQAMELYPNDPDVQKTAGETLARNEAYLKTVGADPKKAKILQKSLDWSYTDPEKNNTPEAKAGMQGSKEAEQAVKTDTDHKTPAEKQIGDLLDRAQGKTPPSQLVDKVKLGQAPSTTSPQVGTPQPMTQQPQLGAAPTTQAPPMAQARPQLSPQTSQAMGKAAMTPTVTQPQPQAKKSITPALDAYMKMHPSVMEQNPLYAAQVERQAKQEEAWLKSVLPRIIDAESRQQVANTAARTRENVQAMGDYAKHINAVNRDATLMAMSDQAYAGKIKAANIAYARGVAMATIASNTALTIAQEKFGNNPLLGLKTIGTELSRQQTMMSQLSLERSRLETERGSNHVIEGKNVRIINQDIENGINSREQNLDIAFAKIGNNVDTLQRRYTNVLNGNPSIVNSPNFQSVMGGNNAFGIPAQQPFFTGQPQSTNSPGGTPSWLNQPVTPNQPTTFGQPGQPPINYKTTGPTDDDEEINPAGEVAAIDSLFND